MSKLNTGTLRKFFRSVRRLKQKLLLSIKKKIIERMLELVRFLMDKDRLAQVIHQNGQAIFALLIAEFQYKAHKVWGIILALCDSRTTGACRLSLIRDSVTNPQVAFTIAFFFYQVLWGYLPNRRRIRALVYRIVERPIERLLERAEIFFFYTEVGRRIVDGLDRIALTICVILLSYVFPFLPFIVRVRPPYPPWWFLLLLRILFFLFSLGFIIMGY